MTYTDKILEEFDLLTRDQYELDLEYDDAKVWLKNNPHLFTGGVYDEPMLTLDRDKIRAFLATKLHQALAEDRERVVAMINDQKYTRGDYIPDDGGYMDAYDKALDDLLSSLDKPLTDKE